MAASAYAVEAEDSLPEGAATEADVSDLPVPGLNAGDLVAAGLAARAEDAMLADGSDLPVLGVNASGLAAADLADLVAAASGLSEGNLSSESGMEALLLMRGGWHQGGDKIWGGGSGVEVVNSGNVGYYNAGMGAARARCHDAGCALIVNPAGHRTVHVFHIHFVHFAGYGANLKRKMESEVCGRSGWHRGGLPCSGKAAFFPGFPGVFSKALTGGGMHHASVIAWPDSCGGRGTIVELAYGCSIEHQIRGDYNPKYR